MKHETVNALIIKGELQNSLDITFTVKIVNYLTREDIMLPVVNGASTGSKRD